jgi:hypothetical protein
VHAVHRPSLLQLPWKFTRMFISAPFFLNMQAELVFSCSETNGDCFTFCSCTFVKIAHIHISCIAMPQQCTWTFGTYYSKPKNCTLRGFHHVESRPTHTISFTSYSPKKHQRLAWLHCRGVSDGDGIQFLQGLEEAWGPHGSADYLYIWVMLHWSQKISSQC